MKDSDLFPEAEDDRIIDDDLLVLIQLDDRENAIAYIPYGPKTEHQLYGLYRYKSGFGGKIFHRMSCWDYPLDHEKYVSVKAADIHNRGIHQLRN